MGKILDYELWEKQDGESSKAFDAFTVYRDMGAERSIQKVAQKCTKSESLLRRWSSQYNWVKRVEAWDVEQDRLTRLVQQKVKKEMDERQARMSMRLQWAMITALNSLNLENIKPNDIARLLELGLKYERIARGADAVTQQDNETKTTTTESLADSIMEAYKRRQA